MTLGFFIHVRKLGIARQSYHNAPVATGSTEFLAGAGLSTDAGATVATAQWLTAALITWQSVAWSPTWQHAFALKQDRGVLHTSLNQQYHCQAMRPQQCCDVFKTHKGANDARCVAYATPYGQDCIAIKCFTAQCFGPTLLFEVCNMHCRLGHT